jgi:hypothetical protein
VLPEVLCFERRARSGKVIIGCDEDAPQVIVDDSKLRKSGPTKQLSHFTSGVIWDYGWSPDGKFIALARRTDQSDAVLFTSAK